MSSTYRKNLKDVDWRGVQSFILVICWKGHWYVSEVLREQDDECCGPDTDIKGKNIV